MKRNSYRRRIIRKTIATILMAALFLAPEYGNRDVFGAPEKQNRKVSKDFSQVSGDLPRSTYMNIPWARPTDSEPGPEPSAVALPAYYSSVRKGYVTSIKDQGAWGTCSFFAAASTLESSALRNRVKVRNTRLTRKNLDLSEYQLAYFMYHRQTDPLKMTAGDTVKVNGDYLILGGNNGMNSMRLLSWSGPVKEKLAPYEITGKKLASSLAYSQDLLHVQGVYLQNPSNVAAVKRLIRHLGAVSVTFQSDYTYFDDDYCSYYCPYSEKGNHSVSLVGWDDNFSRKHFSPYTPSSDGAWLIKNSWGDSMGNNGFYWISYEDKSLVQDFAIAYDTESVENYDYNYQYDGGVAIGCNSGDDKKIAAANVFTVAGPKNQILKAIGISSYTNSNSTYSIQIYKSPRRGKPMSGKKLLDKPLTGTIRTGFLTVKLPVGIRLKRGETFSVAVTLKNSQGAHVMVDASANFGWVSIITKQKKGTSYLISGGKVQDLAKASFSYFDENGNFQTSVGETARIKAYTVKQ